MSDTFDQPRDLAREQQGILEWLEACACGDPIESRRESFERTYNFIASQSRELELQREALRWTLARGAKWSLFDRVPKLLDRQNDELEPPVHLRAVLEQAVRSEK